LNKNRLREQQGSGNHVLQHGAAVPNLATPIVARAAEPHESGPKHVQVSCTL